MHVFVHFENRKKNEERKMTQPNESVLVEEMPGRWQSLLSSLTAFSQALDYDPQEHAFVLLDQLGESVSQLEANELTHSS